MNVLCLYTRWLGEAWLHRAGNVVASERTEDFEFLSVNLMRGGILNVVLIKSHIFEEIELHRYILFLFEHS